MNVSCPECSTVYRVDPAKVPQGGVRARCSTCNGVISIGLAADSGVKARRTPSDPMGDAFAPRPAPFIPTHTLHRQASRVPTPVMPAPAQRTPPEVPRVPTPVAQPRIPTPAVNRTVTLPHSPMPTLGASLPPLRPTPATPRTAWQPMAAIPAPPAPAPGRPVSVPSVTPPSGSFAPSPAASPVPTPAPGERRPINPFLARDPGLRAKRLARALVSDMVAYYPAKHSEGLEKGTLKDLFRDEIKKSYDEYVAQVGADFARTTTHFQESLNEVLGAGKKIF
jgi:predicted Zn finger-like uncharacterized protein